MQLEFAFLSDSAEAVGGKLYVLGGCFDTIWTKQVPVTHHHMALSMRFELTPSEFGHPHKLEVLIVDEDGHRVAAANGVLNVAPDPRVGEKWRPQRIIFVLNFGNLKFEKFGDHAIDVLVNDSSVKNIPLRIAPLTESPVKL